MRILIIGEFILSKPNIQMQPAFKQYSVNESYSPAWDPRIKAFIEKKKTSGEKPIPQRYCLYENAYKNNTYNIYI